MTDAQGKFTFVKLPPASAGKSTSRRLVGWVGYDLVARAKDGRLAWIGQFRVLQQEATDLWLPLAVRADIQGRLVNQAGKPIAEVEITPNSLDQEEKPVRRSIMATLPAALSSSLRVTTVPDGSFVLPGFPQVSFVHAKMRADGLGTVKRNVT